MTVSEFTGAMSYNYPLSLPAARGAIQPSLNFTYSNQNTDEETAVGYGWDLTLSSIERDTSLGTDVMYKTDQYVLSTPGGTFKMIKTGTEAGWGDVYLAKYGNNTLKMGKLTVGSVTGWIVKDSDGNTFQYLAPAIGSCVGSAVFSWNLSKSIDTNGNEITYDYENDYSNPPASYIYGCGINYLKTVQYNFVNGVAATKISFTYDLIRPSYTSPDDEGVIISAKRGYLTSLNRRMKEINFYESNQRRRLISLQYQPGNNGIRALLSTITETGYDSAGQATVLPPVKFQYSGNSSGAFTETTGYNYPLPNAYFANAMEVNVIGKQVILAARHGANFDFATGTDLMDINGDGLMDQVNTGGFYPGSAYGQVVLNDGTTGFSTPGTPLDSSLNKISLGVLNNINNTYYYPSSVTQYPIEMVDLNGDQKFDIVESWQYVTSLTPYKKTRINLGNNTFTDDANYALPEIMYWVNSFDAMRDMGVRFGDVNGDGLPDLVRFFSGYEKSNSNFPGPITVQKVYINTGAGFVDQTPSWQTPAGVYFSEITLYDRLNNFQLMDINGDGLADLVGTRGGDYFLNTGHGWVGTGASGRRMLPLTLEQLSYFGGENNWLDSGVRFVDINGDGLLDMVQRLQDNVSGLGTRTRAFLNTGGRFHEVSSQAWPIPVPITYYNVPRKPSRESLMRIPLRAIYASSTGVSFTDINNDGMTDVVLASLRVEVNPTIPNNQDLTRTNRFFINQNNLPDMLIGIDNSQGGKVKVSYQLSSKYRDSAGTNLNKNLPLNIWTAQKVETWDGVSGEVGKQTVTYTYGGGKYVARPLYEKGFAGFSEVTKTDSAGNKTVLNFLQDEPLRGQISQMTVFDNSGKKLQQVENNYQTITLNSVGTFTRKYGVLSTSLTRTFDGGLEKDTAIEYVYDPITGNVLKEINYGEVQGSATVAQFTDIGPDKLVTEKDFLNNPTLNIFSEVTEQRLTDGSLSNVLQKEQYFYDNLGLGSVSKGNLTRVATFYKEENRYFSETFSYDKFGNPVTKTDPRGAMTSLTYDTSGRYVILVKNALNQRTNLTYDNFLGKALTITDPNRQVFKMKYDGAGRILELESPDPVTIGARVTNLKISYETNIIPNRITTLSYFTGNATKYVKSVSYYDGLGRAVQAKQETETDPTTVTTTFDNLGQKSFVSLPYFDSTWEYSTAALSSQPGTKYGYDALGRVVSQKTSLGETKISFSGWTTTVVNVNNQKKDSEKDAYEPLPGFVLFLSRRLWKA